jgi:ATP-binding cassette subfamily D (ALD) long-chain fatty acid import protein
LADRTAGFFTNRRILMNTSDAIGRIMRSWRKVNELSGYTARVAQMFHVFDDMEASRFQRNFKPLPLDHDPSAAREPFVGQGKVVDSEFIQVEGLTLVNPTGDVLAENMSFTVPRGTHVFISGPNGCGKSSLFRVLGGLWPVVKGTVKKPLKDKALFYIPQRPYLSLGSLRDQIIYPMDHDAFVKAGGRDEELMKILGIVKLEYLIDNYGGFDAVKNWKDCLSGGEKQRVAMARLFFHRPNYAILDECSSAVSIDVEGAMYTEAKKQGISLITVSHRHTLWKFHEYILTMDGKGGWSFGPMAEIIQKQEANSVQNMTLEEEKRDLEKRLREVEGLLTADK